MNPNADAPSAPDEMYVSCPSCKAMLLASDLEDNRLRLPPLRPPFAHERQEAHPR